MQKVYLATPYNHDDIEVMKRRYNAVTEQAGILMQKGCIVYSPITHNHPIAELGLAPRGWEYWKDNDSRFIEWCNAMYIFDLPGWRESTGVTAEIKIARELKKSVFHIIPTKVCLEKYRLV